MHFHKKHIFGEVRDVLDVVVADADDVNEITQQYAAYQCIQIDLSSMNYLGLFQCITTLVLTAGVPTPDGLSCLYNLKSLINLVLDFEETDSDIEGIQLDRFPNLKNVLSRSNLNIKKYNPSQKCGYTVQVLNFYLNGKQQKVRFAPNYDIFKPPQFLFFSTESYVPASTILMSILVPAEKLFQVKYGSVRFSQNIDLLSIIPICVPQNLIDEGLGKVRRNVSLKRRAADIRLRIPYQLLLDSDEKTRQSLCIKAIEESATYVARRDNSFQFTEFMKAVNNVFAQVNSEESVDGTNTTS